MPFVLFQVIRSYHRILDLKEKHVDAEVLSILVSAIIDNKPDNSGESCERLHGDAAKLLGRLTSQNPTEAKLWENYADLLMGKTDGSVDPVKICQFMQKSVACMSQKSGWEKDTEKALEVLKLAEKYAKGTIFLVIVILKYIYVFQVK